MLKAMEEKLSNVVIGEFVKVEAITPEELRAYLQYITNPIDMMWLRASGIKKGPINTEYWSTWKQIWSHILCLQIDNFV